MRTAGVRWGGLVACLVVLGIATVTHAAPHRYALLVGLNQHLSALEVPPLRFARRDVEALAEVLRRSGYDVTSLLDGQARREAIVGELARFAAVVKEDDVFVLYYVGHAVRNASNRRIYWLAYDTSLPRLETDGIRLSHLLDYVQDIRARHKLLLLDHYVAGQLIRQPQPGGDGPDRKGGRKDDGPLSLERGVLSADELESGFRKTGDLAVLASARGDAYERDDLGHSVFAATLLEALNSGAADTNKDRALSVDELAAFAKEKITRLTEGQQQPVTFVEGFTNWSIVEGLTAPEDEERRALVRRFLDRLQRWSLQDLITIETRIRTIDVLLRWSDAKSVMGPADLLLIRVVRVADGVDPSTPDPVQARLFEDGVQAIRW